MLDALAQGLSLVLQWNAFSLMLVGMAYPLNEIVVPWTRWSRRMLFRDATPQILKSPQPGKQDFRIGSMRIRYTDHLDGRMQNPTVSKYDKNLVLVMEWFAPSVAILAVLDLGPPTADELLERSGVAGKRSW